MNLEPFGKEKHGRISKHLTTIRLVQRIMNNLFMWKTLVVKILKLTLTTIFEFYVQAPVCRISLIKNTIEQTNRRIAN